MNEAAMAIHLRNVAVTLSHVRTRVLDGRPISETDRLLGDAREAILNIAAEVERLTPKAMTDDETCALLNEIAYSGGRDWKPDEYGHGYIQSEWLKEGMGSWTAHAIAAQLLREKEAARA